MVSFLKNLKLKLQFTGWLQYLFPVGLAVIFLIFAVLFWILDLEKLAIALTGMSLLFVVITILDLLTVKYNFRPRERLPQRRDDTEVFDLMMARRSCRSFQNRKLTPADYKELLQAVQQINDPANSKIGNNTIRLEYIHARLTVWPVVGAQEFLVAIVPKTYSRQSVIDVGRNLQKVVLYATRMGLATCWIGPGADQTSIVRHLGDKFDLEKDHIICVCAIGYKSSFIPITLRLASVFQHKRLPLSALFFTDSQLKEAVNTEVYPYKRFGRNYEVCQWAPSSFNGQTTRCVAVLETTNEEQSKEMEVLTNKKECGLKRFDFYASTKSHYYAPVALGIWCANWEMGCEALGIKGQFERVSEKNGMNTNTELPIYDVSWVLKKMN